MNREYKKPPPPGPPVPGLPIAFDWNPEWEALFDLQTAFVRGRVVEERAKGNLIVYLSCPISNRGGGYYKTNVAISEWVQARVERTFGRRVWVLNPAEYQMQSVSGENRMAEHAATLKMDIEKFAPRGGDYMRMWTRVLAADDEGYNQGDYFDAFYFLGPTETREFFVDQAGIQIVSAAVEDYLARRSQVDDDFRSYMDRKKSARDPRSPRERRADFVRFYTLRGGANYSRGCHDEWNIWVELNKDRVFKTRRESRTEETDIGSQIAGFFDGRPIDPAGFETKVAEGYAHRDYPPVPTTGEKRPKPG